MNGKDDRGKFTPRLREVFSAICNLLPPIRFAPATLGKTGRAKAISSPHDHQQSGRLIIHISDDHFRSPVFTVVR